MSSENERQRVTIEILGEKYVVRSTSPQQHVLEVGKHVDHLLKELQGKYPRIGLQKVAILAALNLASELLPLQKAAKDEKGDGEK
ncbi:MAG: cell division protein ZapA [Firmicutes bacterium]|nr:cell division protein ZapA [Bacillota bacterium]